MPFFWWYVLLSVLWTVLGCVLMSGVGTTVRSCITAYWQGRLSYEVSLAKAMAGEDLEKLAC